MPPSRERYPVKVINDSDNTTDNRTELLNKLNRWNDSVSENKDAVTRLKKVQPKKAVSPSIPTVPKITGGEVTPNKDSVLKTAGKQAVNTNTNNLSNSSHPTPPPIIPRVPAENNTPQASPTNAPIAPQLPSNSRIPVTSESNTLKNDLDKSSKISSKTPDASSTDPKKIEDMIKGREGEFWDNVRNNERNHNFDLSSLHEFVLDRKAQDGIGIQRDPNKVLSEPQELALQKETERLRKDSGLPASPTERDRMYFIDKAGKRQIDLNYLKSHGYNPTIDANIPGAIFLSPSITPQKGNTTKSPEDMLRGQESPHAQEALKRVNGYLKGDPGIQKMIKEISDITGTPVLIGGIGLRTSSAYGVGGVNMPLSASKDSQITETLSDKQKNYNNTMIKNLWRSSGFNGDVDRFHNSRDGEQGILMFAQGGANKETVRNEVGELWMSAKELKDHGSTGINNSATTQIATWHTDKALSMNEKGYTQTKSQPDSPDFWRGFAQNFNASQKIDGMEVANFYTKHLQGQRDLLVGDTQKQAYAGELYNQRLAYFYNIDPNSVPLNWTFKEENNGKIRATPTLRKK